MSSSYTGDLASLVLAKLNTLYYHNLVLTSTGWIHKVDIIFLISKLNAYNIPKPSYISNAIDYEIYIYITEIVEREVNLQGVMIEKYKKSIRAYYSLTEVEYYILVGYNDKVGLPLTKKHLDIAARYNNEIVVNYILESPSFPKKDVSEVAVKHMIKNNMLEAIKRLISNNCMVAYSTLLWVASKYGRFEIVKLLYNSNSIENIEKAIKIAIIRDHYDIIAFLLNTIPNRLKDSVLDNCASISIMKSDLRTISILLNNGLVKTSNLVSIAECYANTEVYDLLNRFQ